MGDVPEVVDRKVQRGLAVEIDDELNDPSAKKEADHEEENGEWVKAEKESVFSRSKSWFDESEEEKPEERK